MKVKHLKIDVNLTKFNTKSWKGMQNIGFSLKYYLLCNFLDSVYGFPTTWCVN
jgi:hypothetical protein